MKWFIQQLILGGHPHCNSLSLSISNTQNTRLHPRYSRDGKQHVFEITCRYPNMSNAPTTASPNLVAYDVAVRICVENKSYQKLTRDFLWVSVGDDINLSLI